VRREEARICGTRNSDTLLRSACTAMVGALNDGSGELYTCTPDYASARQVSTDDCSGNYPVGGVRGPWT
jgi:hypothetical protein